MTSDKRDNGGFGYSRAVLGSRGCDVSEVEGLSDNVNIVSALTDASGKLGFHSLRFEHLGGKRGRQGVGAAEAPGPPPSKEPSREVKGQIHGVLTIYL